MIIEPIVEIVVVEVCSGEIRSIRHPILSKIGSSGLGMNSSRIIQMTPSDDIGLIRWSTDDQIDRIDQIIWSNSVYFDNFFFKLNFFFKKKNSSIPLNFGVRLERLGFREVSAVLFILFCYFFFIYSPSFLFFLNSFSCSDMQTILFCRREQLKISPFDFFSSFL